MSTCWKCGRDLTGDQTECEPFCGFEQHRAETVRRMEAVSKEQQENAVPIDFSKMKTIEDIVEFLSVFYGGCSVDRRYPVYQRLKKFTAEADQ